MEAKAKALLEKYRQAESAGEPTLDRICESLHTRLAVGVSALQGIDASTPKLPSPSWSFKLAGIASSKPGLLLGFVVTMFGGVAGMLWLTDALRTDGPHTPSASPSPGVEASVPARPGLPNPTISETASTPARTPVSERANRAIPQSGVSASNRSQAHGLKTKPASLQQHDRKTTSTTRSDPPSSVADQSVKHELAPALERSDARTSSNAELDAELSLLRQAYARLNAGRAAEALQLLDEHQARFPRGQLSESRDVATMLALCAIGRRPAAEERARQFLALHPQSPFVHRVRGICGPETAE